MTDQAFFEELYREYQPKVSGYIHSHVNDAEDAEDLCSEVFYDWQRDGTFAAWGKQYGVEWGANS